MTNDNELADNEILSVPEAIREIWDSWTTSQKLNAITPEMAKAYRLEKANQNHLQDVSQVVHEIQRKMNEQEEQRKEREGWIKRGVLMILKGMGWVK